MQSQERTWLQFPSSLNSLTNFWEHDSSPNSTYDGDITTLEYGKVTNGRPLSRHLWAFTSP